MHQSASSAASSQSTNPDILHLLWKTNVHYCTHTASCWHKSTAIWILSLISLPTSLRSILILCWHPHPGLSSKFFLTGFPRTFWYTILPSTIHTTPSTIIAVRYKTSPITHNKHHILWRSALCSFLQPPDTSYTLSSNSFLSSTPSNTTNPLCSPLPILHPTT
jgi:hypothetical protein